MPQDSLIPAERVQVGKYFGLPVDLGTPFDRVARQFLGLLERSGYASTTKQNYRVGVQRGIDALGARPLRDLDEAEWFNFIYALNREHVLQRGRRRGKKGLSFKTLEAQLAPLLTLLDDLSIRIHGFHNGLRAARHVYIGRARYEAPNWLKPTEGQAATWLAQTLCLDTDYYYQPAFDDILVFLLAVGLAKTGGRIASVTRLRLRSFPGGLRRGWIFLPRSGKVRVIDRPIDDEFGFLIDWYLRTYRGCSIGRVPVARLNEFAFLGPRGQPAHRWFPEQLRQSARLVGLNSPDAPVDETCVAHSFRGLWQSRLISAGPHPIDPLVLAKIRGDKPSPEHLAAYNALPPDFVRESYVSRIWKLAPLFTKGYDEFGDTYGGLYLAALTRLDGYGLVEPLGLGDLFARVQRDTAEHAPTDPVLRRPTALAGPRKVMVAP